MLFNYNKYKKLGIDKINELFRYDEKTGLLYNKVNRNGYQKDHVAGHIDSEGYWIVSIEKIAYREHVLIWMLYHNGEVPNGEIDHVNRVRSDNRLENLMDVTRSINQYNYSVYGKSIYKGVSWHNPNHKWQSRIWVDGRSKYIGCFVNEIDAARARDMTARDMGLEERLMNFPQCSGCLIK